MVDLLKVFGFHKDKFEKNYLRIYANLTQKEYSDGERQAFSDSLIYIANALLKNPKLKYDIGGPGYNISKGSPFMGETAFKNRIKKKGYANMSSMVVCEESMGYHSSFTLFTNIHVTHRVDFEFNWPYTDSESLKEAITIIKLLSSVCAIDYGYAYSTDHSLSNAGEWKIRKTISGMSSNLPEDELSWTKHIQEIGLGIIKKIYPLNCYNRHQIKEMSDLRPPNPIYLSDGIEIWQFDQKDLKSLNAKTMNAILH